MKTASFLTHLECGLCGERLDADRLWNLCPEVPEAAPRPLRPGRGPRRPSRPADLAGREPTMWRYRELLPVRDDAFKLCLGEGFTPLFRAGRLEREIGHGPVSIVKDEGLNPTGSFKARGLAAAVSRAFELGVKAVSIPTAGNAGCAMSAYAALAGLEAHVFMPADVPRPFINECRVLGARVTLIDGLITDCGKAAREGIEKYGRFDVSTLKEPYRIEGKKTMGYELAEQMSWTLPDVIIYPTGGGTGLVGMWKAFDEMEKLGWIGAKRPRMVTVQSEGCAPMVKAFRGGPGIRRDVAERPDDRRRHARPGGRGRFPHPAGASRERRHGRGRPGRRDPGIDLPHGKDDRDLARAGGRSDPGRLPAAPERRLDPGRRIRRPFQYRRTERSTRTSGTKSRRLAPAPFRPAKYSHPNSQLKKSLDK